MAGAYLVPGLEHGSAGHATQNPGLAGVAPMPHPGHLLGQSLLLSTFMSQSHTIFCADAARPRSNDEAMSNAKPLSDWLRQANPIKAANAHGLHRRYAAGMPLLCFPLAGAMCIAKREARPAWLTHCEQKQCMMYLDDAVQHWQAPLTQIECKLNGWYTGVLESSYHIALECLHDPACKIDRCRWQVN